MAISIRIAVVLLAIALATLLAFALTGQARDTSIDDALAQGEGHAGARLPAQGADSGRPHRDVGAPVAGVARVSPAEPRGTTVAISVRASSCPRCRDEAALFERAWNEAGRRPCARRRSAGGPGCDARLHPRVLDLPSPSRAGEKPPRRWDVTGLAETLFVSGEGNLAGRPRATQAGGDRQAID